MLQNSDELLLLTNQQINLLAHMWGYTVQQGLMVGGQAFGVTLATG